MMQQLTLCMFISTCRDSPGACKADLAHVSVRCDPCLVRTRTVSSSSEGLFVAVKRSLVLVLPAWGSDQMLGFKPTSSPEHEVAPKPSAVKGIRPLQQIK